MAALIFVLLAPLSASAATTYQLSGRVMDNTYRLLPYANVAATDSVTGVRTTVQADGGGNYSIFLPAATYTLTATASPPLMTQTVNNYVLSGQATYDFVLSPAGSITVTGRVLDELGLPLPNQPFTFKSTTAGQPDVPGSSALDGTYSATMAPGAYNLTMSNHVLSEMHAPEFYDLDTTSPISLTASQTLDLKLPEVHFQVNVTDPAGRPVQGARIETDQSTALNLSIGGAPAQGHDWYQDGIYPTTDASGNATLWLFPNRDQHIMTVFPPALSGLATSSQAVSVLADGSVSFALPSASTLSGQVLDPSGAGIALQTVTLRQSGLVNAPAFSAQTDGTGTYSFSQLNSGAYNVTINATNPNSSYNAPQQYSVTTSSPITVASGPNTQNFTLPEVPVAVTVLGAGAPIGSVGLVTDQPGVSLTLGGLSASGQSFYSSATYAPTSAAGTSRLWLFPGTYQVTAVPPSGSGFGTTVQPLTIPAGATSAALTINLLGGYLLRGTVRDENGAPVGGQIVSVSGEGVSASAPPTGADGQYTFTLPAGAYQFGIRGSTLAGANAPAGYNLTLAPGVTLAANTNLDLQLPFVRVSALATGPAGSAVQGVSVSTPPRTVSGLAAGAYSASGTVDSGTVVTGPDGAATLWVTPGSTYSFSAQPPPAYHTLSVTQTVNADTSLPLQLAWVHAAPVVTGTTTGVAGGGTTTVTLAAATFQNLPATIYFTVDGGPVTPYTGPFPVNGVIGSLHTVNFWAVDAAGVPGYPAGPLSFAIPGADSTPPVITYTRSPLPNPAGWNTGPVTVTWSISDPESGIAASRGCASGALVIAVTTTVSCSATNGAGLTTVVPSFQVLIDTTLPVISYSGNLGTYSLDQTVAITCTATDVVSGPATQPCAGAAGPAYNFYNGGQPFLVTSTATSVAGNTATATTSFTVTVTGAGLCGLVQQFETKSGVAHSMCVKLQHGDYGAFINEVRAQSGKSMTVPHADLLISLATPLAVRA